MNLSLRPIGYPRSFLGLLMTAFLLVVLPLAAALAYSIWSIERLAEQSRDAVFSATQVARASRALASRASAIERTARQIAVQQDVLLLVDLARARTSFKDVADELARQPLEAEPRALLERTVTEERALNERLSLSVSALRLVEPGQIVEGAADPGGVRPEHLFDDGKGSAVKRLSLCVALLLLVQLG